MNSRYFLVLLLALELVACRPAHPPPGDTPDLNPAAAGFLAAESDSLAIQLADSVMVAMGGRANWDSTRYLTWNFFGMRTHVWDRYAERVRIDSHRDSLTYLINLRDSTGQIYHNGLRLEDAAATSLVLDGISIWINDSYWLVLPFKLKDSGVRLRYLGESAAKDKSPADLIELTFKEVGDTPQNKYHVWIDQRSGLLVQWAYFRHQEDTQPLFIQAWTDYRQYGKILLSGKRDDRELSHIAVLDSVPEHTFTTY